MVLSLIETCPTCRIPTSSQGELRWCIYCVFAADKTTLLTRHKLVRTSTGGELELCLSNDHVKHAIVRLSGEQWRKPRFRLKQCDIVFTGPVAKKTKVLVEFFTPKEGW